MSIDPQGVDAATAINFNRCSYALNSPYAKYDPSGRDPVSAVVGLVVGAGWGWFNGYLVGDSGSQLWADAGAGAAVGGLAGLTDGLSLVGGAATNTALIYGGNAAAAAGVEALRQESNYGEITSDGSIVMAGASSVLGSAATDLGVEIMMANDSTGWLGTALNGSTADILSGAADTGYTAADNLYSAPPVVGPLNMTNQNGDTQPTASQNQGDSSDDPNDQ